MLETLLNFGTSILTGGTTGLLGTAVSGAIDFFQARQRHAQEMDLRRLDIELARAEAEGAMAHAAIEAEAARERAEWKALEASYRAASRRWSRAGESWAMQLVDVVRGLTRPALTWSLFTLVGRSISCSAPRSSRASRSDPASSRSCSISSPPRCCSDSAPARSRSGAVSAVVVACVSLFVRVRRLESAGVVTRKSLGDLEKRDPGVSALVTRMETVEHGLVKLSATLEALPDSREFAALGRSVTAVQGEIAALRATVDGMDKMIAGLDKQLNQINAHLLAGGG